MNKDICVHKNTQLDMLKTAADPHMPQPFAELWFCLFFLLFDETNVNISIYFLENG